MQTHLKNNPHLPAPEQQQTPETKTKRGKKKPPFLHLVEDKDAPKDTPKK
jgi:hypothetical protein